MLQDQFSEQCQQQNDETYKITNLLKIRPKSETLEIYSHDWAQFST